MADAPVVLLSGGIGVTPVLAMLQVLAAQHSPREAWWLRTARSPGNHVLADEARRLLTSLPTAHRHTLYTAAEPGTARRRLDPDALAALGLSVRLP